MIIRETSTNVITSFQIDGSERIIDAAHAIDISIPLNFNGPQPNAYGVEAASSKPVEAGDLVGDTRLGGSVNFEQYTFIPHCSGTHTECVGHITNERISIRDCLQDVFIRAILISVDPEWTGSSEDLVITHEALETAIKSVPEAVASGLLPSTAETESAERVSDTALIVRTLPNDDSKLTREYGDVIPPYFSTEAMQYVVGCGYKHVLVDLPSVDRIFDDGKLLNHRIFWNVEEDSLETNENTRLDSTITELIYVPSDIEDGEYLLNLQIAPFASDASPSRPVLFKIN